MRAIPKVLKVGDPKLWAVSAEVQEGEFKKMKKLDEQIRMIHRIKSAHGVAAPQIGVNRRVFSSSVGGYKLYVNPEVVETRGKVYREEGCLSLPGLFLEIERPAEVYLQAVLLDGTMVDVEASGLEARLFLHEIDHLDGKTMFDNLLPEQLEEVRKHRLFRERPASLA